MPVVSGRWQRIVEVYSLIQGRKDSYINILNYLYNAADAYFIMEVSARQQWCYEWTTQHSLLTLKPSLPQLYNVGGNNAHVAG